LAAAAVAPLAAGEVVTNTRTSFTTETVTCSGEVITVEPRVHLLSRVSDRRSRGRPSWEHDHHVLHRTSASGARYIGTSHQTTELRVSSVRRPRTRRPSTKPDPSCEDGTAMTFGAERSSTSPSTRMANSSPLSSTFVSECA
jgi:hypothetical protein